MRSKWREVRAGDVIEFNPTLSLPKGMLATKIAMEKLLPYTKRVNGITLEKYAGGAKFCNGDTIMARITPCLENGKTAYVDVLRDGEVGFGSTEFIVLRAKPGVTDKQYVYYLSISPTFRKYAIKSMVGSSGRQRVQQSVLDDMILCLPPLEEQVRIGKCLTVFDDRISLNNQINDNLLQQAQAIYASMFITDANPSWPIGHLSDLITVKYGKDHKKLSDGCYPVYGSGGIMRYVERPLYTEESVLIPRKGTLNNVMYVCDPFWSVDTMFYSEMRVQNVAKYVYHFLRGKDLASMNAGSAVPSMTTDILNALELVIPPASVLAEFETIVAPMYKLMKANTRESTKLANIRDALLPKMMSGEIDVSSITL